MCLPKLGNKYVGEKATVVGWGRTAHGKAETPSKLQVNASFMIYVILELEKNF